LNQGLDLVAFSQQHNSIPPPGGSLWEASSETGLSGWFFVPRKEVNISSIGVFRRDIAHLVNYPIMTSGGM
jgi:hypothetical protein